MGQALLIGNWKMNKLVGDVGKFCTEFRQNFAPQKQVECMIAPTYLSISEALKHSATSGLGVASQNVHFEKSGAFTGEISIGMLTEIGVRCSIVGHSERRQFFGETDDTVAKKAKALTGENLRAVACVGETKEERQSEKTFEVIKRQLSAILEAVSDSRNLVIAYEPVWAIGTGLNASPEQAEEVHLYIRQMLKQRYQDDGSKISVLYGGSVKSSNIAALYSKPNIDGALIGGSSLDAKEFALIATTVAATKK